MSNGDSNPSEVELNALVRRSKLLATKVGSLVDNGFTRDEALQIVFADIGAGLNEFGSPPTIGQGLSGSPTIGSIPPVSGPLVLDLSTLVGSWQITPTSLNESCSAFGDTFSLRASSVDLSFVGQGQSKLSLVFRDDNASGLRAEGQVVGRGGQKFEFLGQFDISRVNLLIQGTLVSGALEVTLYVQYSGTPFGVKPVGCEDSIIPRTLIRI